MLFFFSSLPGNIFRYEFIWFLLMYSIISPSFSLSFETILYLFWTYKQNFTKNYTTNIEYTGLKCKILISKGNFIWKNMQFYLFVIRFNGVYVHQCNHAAQIGKTKLHVIEKYCGHFWNKLPKNVYNQYRYLKLP